MKGEIEAKLGQGLCGALDLEDSYTSPSDVEAKKLEPTFIMTRDGINDNYFKGAAKAKTKEEKPQLNSLARRKAQSLVCGSIASSDAELNFT